MWEVVTMIRGWNGEGHKHHHHHYHYNHDHDDHCFQCDHLPSPSIYGKQGLSKWNMDGMGKTRSVVDEITRALLIRVNDYDGDLWY